jgi:hypothetical protein
VRPREPAFITAISKSFEPREGKISHLFEKTVVVISSEREKSFLTVLLPWASVSS